MYCADELSLLIFNTLKFGIFSENVPVLIYYSHLTAVAVSLFIGLFLFFYNFKSLSIKIFLGLTIVFAIFTISDIFLWIIIDSSWLMFIWSFWLFLFILIYTLGYYFHYVMITKKDVSLYSKLTAIFFLSVIIFSSASNLNLKSFDVTNCNAEEGIFLINSIFLISFLISILVAISGFISYRKTEDILERRKNLLVTIGVLSFFIMFSVASYIASIANLFGSAPDTFLIEQYGFFGMTIFIALLTYTVVQYKAFNIKLIASQALVMALIVLVGSQFLFVRNFTSVILTGVTFIFVIVFGFFLVRSVKQVEEQRVALEKANERQKSLMHFINHQIKGFLTRSRTIFDVLKSGDYGPLSQEVKELVDVGFDTNTQAVEMVKSILDASNLETGTVTYQMVKFDLKTLVSDLTNQLKPTAITKGLDFEIELNPKTEFMVNGDLSQLAQAIRNLIENAIQYTEKGKISIKLSEQNGHLVFSVQDTGMGLSEKDKAVLFSQGGRGEDATRKNVNSTGYGLYIVNQIVRDHGGFMKATSEGRDKGSTFSMILPSVKK